MQNATKKKPRFETTWNIVSSPLSQTICLKKFHFPRNITITSQSRWMNFKDISLIRFVIYSSFFLSRELFPHFFHPVNYYQQEKVVQKFHWTTCNRQYSMKRYDRIATDFFFFHFKLHFTSQESNSDCTGGFGKSVISCYEIRRNEKWSTRWDGECNNNNEKSQPISDESSTAVRKLSTTPPFEANNKKRVSYHKK